MVKKNMNFHLSSDALMRTMLLFVIMAVALDSLLMSRICVGFIFITCIIIGLREKNVVNPFFLFSITPLSLLLYYNFGGLYLTDLRNRTWILAIINCYCFLFALFYTPPFKHTLNCIGMSNNRTLKKHAILLYVISYLGGFIEPLASILWMLQIAGTACALKTKETKMFYLVILFIMLSLLSGQTSKMSVLLNVLTIIICYNKYYVKSNIGFVRLLCLVTVGVFFMIFSFRFANKDRGASDAIGEVEYYTRNGMDWGYSAMLFMPYMYLETPWVNVDYVIKTQDKRTYGLWAIKPFIGYFGIDENYKKEYELEPYSAFNTYTFITPGFKDFGYWLSVIMSLFLGLYCKKIYTRYKKSSSPLDVACYIAVALATVEMFFSNHFFMQSYPFTIFFLMEIYKRVVVAMKDNKPELEPK